MVEASSGELVHLLPTVSHDRILLKASFLAPQAEAPSLLVDGRRIEGVRTDSDGLFWLFDAPGLESDRDYDLELRRGRTPLSDAWSLATFPAPDAAPDHLRLLVYGCAGGHDVNSLYQPTAVRRRLLRRALLEQPDAAVVSGDHVYWDLRSIPNSLLTGASPAGVAHAGEFDFEAAVLGTGNESVLKLAVGAQIAGLYGTLFQSVPVFFIRDDHDYFEDDRFTDGFVSPPPDRFSVELARATQHLYYPEFLPDRGRPGDLPAGGANDRPEGANEAFGTLRYGRLFEGLMYDCKGFVSISGGGVVPDAVEAWLQARTRDADVDHVVHFPSNPPGWSAGKYAEWYPDVVDADGHLTTDIAKPGWQAGWRDQHDRLLESASRHRDVALFVSSDIHSMAEERIFASGEIDLRGNPVVSAIATTPGTRVGWPSAARGAPAAAPSSLDVETVLPVREDNGFAILDFEPGAVTIRHYGWDFRTRSEDEIDTMPPVSVTRYGV